MLFTLDFCVCISMHSVNSFWNILELRNHLLFVLSSCYCFVMHNHAQFLKNFVLVIASISTSTSTSTSISTSICTCICTFSFAD